MTPEQAIKIIDTRTPEEKKNGLCLNCGEYKKSTKCSRQNTAYVQEEKNFIIVCDECFEDIGHYWDQCWKDLYGEIHAGIQAGNLADKI